MPLGHEHQAAIRQHLEKSHGANSPVLIEPIGSGIHASGFQIIFGESQERRFLRIIEPVNFGHDLPSARIETMLEANHSLPHALSTHTIFGINASGEIIDLSDLREVVALAEFLPEGAINFGSMLRMNTTSTEENHALAELVRDHALSMAHAMADIHDIPYTGSSESATSLYKRSLRAVIHTGELTAGVMDLIDWDTARWIRHEDAVNFMGDMERVRFCMGVQPERLRRVHGDYWPNNIYFSNEKIIVTDGRIVWGEPGIDAGWMIGEFLMQDLLRFGQFGKDFTSVASEAFGTYFERTRDREIQWNMALPYAFQAFAEAYFTPDISDAARTRLFATARGALKYRLDKEPFQLSKLNSYMERGLQLLRRPV